MDSERILEFMFTVVGAGTAGYWVVILFMRYTFPFERTGWHFAAGGILAVLSICTLLAWLSSPSSPARRQLPVLDDIVDPPSDESCPNMVLNEDPTTPVADVLVDEPPPSAASDESDRRLANPLYSLADLVQAVRPAVVRIHTASGSGSGFIINAHGTIVTNRHVVGHHPSVVVRLDDGRRVSGRVSRIHPVADLAIVRITAPHLEDVPLADVHRVPVGAHVVAFGYPLADSIGPEMTVTEGILSAKRVRHGLQELQTTAAVNPGNSGGPLVDLATGGVVGVIFASIDEGPRGTPIEGIHFAISINEVKTWLTSR